MLAWLTLSVGGRGASASKMLALLSSVFPRLSPSGWTRRLGCWDIVVSVYFCAEDVDVSENITDGEGEKGPSVKDRLDARKRQGGASPAAPEKQHSRLQSARGLLDALVLAYVIAMFIRSFVFELFMIPTGSMTPTLIGDRAGEVAMVDYDGDGIDDVVYTLYRSQRPSTVQVYLMNADKKSYRELLFVDQVDPRLTRELVASSKRRTDMILVNKFAYWFKTPERGDIAVFKVPDRPSGNKAKPSTFDPLTPVYIKRVLGLPGETVTIQPSDVTALPLGHADRRGSRFGGVELVFKGNPVLINGAPVANEAVDAIVHFPSPSGEYPFPYASRADSIMKVHDNAVLMIGDNAASSLDGRFWGDVPEDHLRGRAVLRYLPFGTWRFF